MADDPDTIARLRDQVHNLSVSLEAEKESAKRLRAENALLRDNAPHRGATWGDKVKAAGRWFIENKTGILAFLLLCRAGYREVFPATDHAEVQAVARQEAQSLPVPERVIERRTETLVPISPGVVKSGKE